MATKGVKIKLNIKEVEADAKDRSRKALRTAMSVVRLRMVAAYSRIAGSTKWKHPGGFGWWGRKIRHGFLKKSIKTTDYETKLGEPGAANIMSNIVFPVEFGTKRSDARPVIKKAVRESASTLRAALKGGRR